MLKVINPATGQTLKEYQSDSAATIREKFQTAKRAFKNWCSDDYQRRAAAIKEFGNLIKRNLDDCAHLLTLEMGKPITQSRNELNALEKRISFFLEYTPKVVADEVVFTDKQQSLTELISYEPLGVVANISAWNYPYFVGANVFVPALLCGNAVLYKPSEFCIGTGLKIAELLHQAGIPKDVFQVVVGGGEAGKYLIEQDVNGIFFTGSYQTGKKISEMTAGRMVRLQLELGGKDPVYVTDDVDVKNVAEAVADGAFYNCGQSCCAVERIYVQEAVYEMFVEHFVNMVRVFKLGDPLNDQTYLGPLARQQQISVLKDQIKDAVTKGANILCGGEVIKGAGNYFQPTVLVNVNHQMTLMRDESFGPIIGIQKVKDDEQAVTLMNDTEYGLTSSVYCRNEKRARSILKQIKSGSVYWNCCDRVSPYLPWSGHKHSGVGVTLSKHGIWAFLHTKAWHLRG